MTDLPETPAQTAGPYIHIGLMPGLAGLERHPQEFGLTIAGPGARGTRIAVEGQVFDGSGAPVSDLMIEIWQADATGFYPGHGSDDADFGGFGRVATDLTSGAFRIDTIKPGPVTEPDGRVMAPHLNLLLAARGVMMGLATRVYFDDEAAANAEDPVLALVPDPQRAATLIAVRSGEAEGTIRYRFDIHLQGDAETVFFDV